MHKSQSIEEEKVTRTTRTLQVVHARNTKRLNSTKAQRHADMHAAILEGGTAMQEWDELT